MRSKQQKKKDKSAQIGRQADRPAAGQENKNVRRTHEVNALSEIFQSSILYVLVLYRQTGGLGLQKNGFFFAMPYKIYTTKSYLFAGHVSNVLNAGGST